MKIISYSIIFFVVYVSSARPKDETIEFHKKIIATTKSDSIRLEHTIHLSWDYRNYNTDSAFHYSNLAINLAKKLNDERLLAKEYDILAYIFINKNQLDSAEHYQLIALDIRKKNNDYRGLRSSYSVMGNIERKNGHFDIALSYYFKALKTIDLIKYNEKELKLYENYEYVDLESQIKLFEKNHEVISKNRPEDGSVKFVHIANTKRLIGEIYLLKDELEEANKYLLEALELNYRLGDGDQVLMNENSMAELNIKEGKYAEAVTRLKRNIRSGKTLTNYYEVANSFLLLSETHKKVNNFSKALELIDSVQYYNLLFSTAENLDFLLVKKLSILNDSAAIDNSMPIVSKSAEIINKIKSAKLEERLRNKDRLELYYVLFNYYLNNDIKDSTILFQTKFYELKDTIIGIDSQNRLNELLKIYETEKKTKLIESQEKKIINYEDLLLLAAILILIVVVFSAIVILNNKKMKKLNANIIELNRQLTESTENKEQLFAYIAHDLRGPLITSNKVISMVLTDDLPEKRKVHYLALLQETIQKSEMFTENLVHWTKSKSGTIKPNISQVCIDEIIDESIKNFKFTIENKELAILQSLPKVTIQTDRILFSAIINNLLQNAIRHCPEGSTISIDMHNAESWELKVTNEGRIDSETIDNFNDSKINHSENGNGLGLIIVKNYSKLIGLDCSISTTSSTTSFIIRPKVGKNP